MSRRDQAKGRGFFGIGMENSKTAANLGTLWRCLGAISWRAAWREWHGRDGCGRYFYVPDERCANRECAVRLAPTGSEWTRLEAGQ